MGTAIALTHDVFDAALLLGVCDKIVPGLLIGALHFGHLPCVFVPAGPMSTGLSNSAKSKVREQAAQGLVGRDQLLQAEQAARPLHSDLARVLFDRLAACDRAAGLPTLKGRAAPKFDSYLLAIEAAIEGQGVAVVPEFMVAPDLKMGRLIKPCPEIDVHHGASWYLACVEDRVLEASTQHFRNWLVAEVAQDQVFGIRSAPP